MARIFISYARRDGSAIAEELADRLRAFEHEVFLDIHSIRAGTRWRFELQRRIAWADLMIVLVTPGSNESENVRQEIALAEKINRPILPLQINDTPAPDHLRSEWQMITLKGENYDRVMMELEHAFRLLPPRSFLPPRFLVALAVLSLVIGGGVFLYTQDRKLPNITPTAENTASGSTATAVMNSSPNVEEDFEDQIADNWALEWGSDFNVIDDGTGNHVWSSTGDGEMFYEPSADWRDYALELDYYVVDWADNDTGVVLGIRRGRDSECRRYDFVLHPGMLAVGASENACENFIFFKETTHSSESGVWHTLYVEVRGAQIQWRLDGGAIQSYEDADRRNPTGRFSILNFHNTEIWFDSLRIWQFE